MSAHKLIHLLIAIIVFDCNLNVYCKMCIIWCKWIDSPSHIQINPYNPIFVWFNSVFSYFSILIQFRFFWILNQTKKKLCIIFRTADSLNANRCTLSVFHCINGMDDRSPFFSESKEMRFIVYTIECEFEWLFDFDFIEFLNVFIHCDCRCAQSTTSNWTEKNPLLGIQCTNTQTSLAFPNYLAVELLSSLRMQMVNCLNKQFQLEVKISDYLFDSSVLTLRLLDANSLRTQCTL